ncbi:hypothetical protein KC992_01875 [Candidatus Saccharibacteria bacterium]|nr:hypothetical protein [Candidatus Saccharibacteria bacterium]
MNSALFERYTRTTVPEFASVDPGALYDLSVFMSMQALGLGIHYGNKFVSAVAPAIEKGPDSHSLKMLAAGNFKPVKDTEGEEYVRVCAEQNLIDNALRVDDELLGVLFVRTSWDGSGLEGTNEHADFCLCRPCRGRTMSVFDPTKLVIVTFVGSESTVPVEATTLQQQIEHHDFGKPKQVLATGADVRDFIVDEAYTRSGRRINVNAKPLIPQRIYKKP